MVQRVQVDAPYQKPTEIYGVRPVYGSAAKRLGVPEGTWVGSDGKVYGADDPNASVRQWQLDWEKAQQDKDNEIGWTSINDSGGGGIVPGPMVSAPPGPTPGGGGAQPPGPPPGGGVYPGTGPWQGPNPNARPGVVPGINFRPPGAPGQGLSGRQSPGGLQVDIPEFNPRDYRPGLTLPPTFTPGGQHNVGGTGDTGNAGADDQSQQAEQLGFTSKYGGQPSRMVRWTNNATGQTLELPDIYEPPMGWVQVSSI